MQLVTQCLVNREVVGSEEAAIGTVELSERFEDLMDRLKRGKTSSSLY